MRSPWDQRAMPPRPYTLPPDHVPGTCTPEFSAQISSSSLLGSAARTSSQVYAPKTNHATGPEMVTQEQQGGVDGGQTRGWGIHMHAHSALHCARQSWSERRRGRAKACGSICTLAPGPRNVRGEPVHSHRLGSASSLPPLSPKAAFKLYHPLPSGKSPCVLVAHFTHLYPCGRLRNLQGPVQNENVGPLVQIARNVPLKARKYKTLPFCSRFCSLTWPVVVFLFAI